MSERFQLSEKDLISDLEQAACCGLPPFLDECVDLYIDEGIAYIGVPRFFTRALRLTAPEGFDLLAAGRTALALPGAEQDGPLARALVKLEALYGADGIVLDLGQPPAARALAAAADASERIAISYWSASSNESSQREITPRTVFTDRGQWYVDADDDRSGSLRCFRIDRITAWEPTGRFDAPRAPAAPTSDAWFNEFSESGTVTLQLSPGGRWAAERYPVQIISDDSEVMVAQFAVASERWLRTLLLQLGPTATLVEPQQQSNLANTAAGELLAARYTERS